MKRKTFFEHALAVVEAPDPRLMSNLADLYQVEITGLHEALEGENADAARAVVRTLIEEVRPMPSPADPKEASDLLGRFPFGQAGLMEFQIIPLGPIAPLRVLLSEPVR